MTSTTAATRETQAPQRTDAIVIGAGFGGMYAVHRLRCEGLSVLGLEAGGDVGGTWYWNRYPGARCDVTSIDYSYAFSEAIEQEWTWSETFAAGSEILAYANFVADRLDLRSAYRFNSRAQVIAFDEARQVWTLMTARGERFEADHLIMATGPLSLPKPIDIPGAESFRGELYRSGKWPHHAVDFSGKRVGLVGTGSSGIQIAPVVAETCQSLSVFQRTPSFTLPMRNRAISDDFAAQLKANMSGLRAVARNTFTGGVRPLSTRPLFSVSAEERNELMEDAWNKGALYFLGLFSDLLTNAAANEVVADFVRGKIDQVVDDPVTAGKLKPRGYPIYARRPCLDTHYYETFNKPHVSLVDCFEEPITAITETGLRTTQRQIDLDVIIMATGFDALTGPMLAIDITGRDGVKLSDAWRDGPRSYLALLMDGFPNLFIIGGPNGPSILANYIRLDEMNVDWVVDCVLHMRRQGLATVEATPEAVARWGQTVGEIADRTLYVKADTWYTGANIEGKPRGFHVFAGGLNRYAEVCAGVAAAGYEGCSFTARQSTI
ncbi:MULTISPECIES: NAD(P)/FAD-dependent oxidoreductase [unclassified Caulobacter]|uniref:flavin-containing monooxygenase n=1 Tax=unclassified Caulobacter TaxID=2648921 RepID=UPI0006F3A371|nr:MULTISPECIES: NAD(P)/FAD-dependent oxidoreductase [unclassified Caulobacter]KQV57042.1 cyclohexanone monooxygenase [Caulobacter sp. Root342]KQV66528.1 cyclohexanone monooxygenase [Caulobacter sp. Root343]